MLLMFSTAHGSCRSECSSPSSAARLASTTTAQAPTRAICSTSSLAGACGSRMQKAWRSSEAATITAKRSAPASSTRTTTPPCSLLDWAPVSPIALRRRTCTAKAILRSCAKLREPPTSSTQRPCSCPSLAAAGSQRPSSKSSRRGASLSGAASSSDSPASSSSCWLSTMHARPCTVGCSKSVGKSTERRAGLRRRRVMSLPKPAESRPRSSMKWDSVPQDSAVTSCATHDAISRSSSLVPSWLKLSQPFLGPLAPSLFSSTSGTWLRTSLPEVLNFQAECSTILTRFSW
mmetsp:Transcript_30717/g.78246  ORF Transcript_30717/g.78246 Transcript_30717/m.78246 type:complete len:290 (-) Transcript_30717:181-1050(-)